MADDAKLAGISPPLYDCPKPFTRAGPKIHGIPTTEHGYRWLGEDGRNVFIEVQGACCCIAFRRGPQEPKSHRRGDVTWFSAASRLRMLKMVNRLDWSRAGRCSFITLTWLDACGRPDPARLTQARSDIQRRLEKEWGRPTAGIWRVEWERRQSGRYVGEYMPHVHAIYYGCGWIDKDYLNDQWGKVLQTKKLVYTKIEEIKSLRQSLYYVSKYIGKTPEHVEPVPHASGVDGEIDEDQGQCKLVIPSYLNNHLKGRKWGMYRKKLLPWAEKSHFRTLPGKLIDDIRAIAREQWDGVPLSADAGFTIFGPAAERIQKLVADFDLQNVGQLIRLKGQS